MPDRARRDSPRATRPDLRVGAGLVGLLTALVTVIELAKLSV